MSRTQGARTTRVGCSNSPQRSFAELTFQRHDFEYDQPRIGLQLIALPAQAQTKTAAESPERVLVTLTDAQIAMVKAAVADQLKDPEASRFSRIKASGFSSESKSLTVCGLINAKYGYGDVGKMPFMILILNGAMGKTKLLAWDEDSEKKIIKWR